MTRSSATLSLFAEPSVSDRRPSSFVLSIMAHLALAGGVYFFLTHLPPIVDPHLLKHYSVRQLDLHTLDPNFPNTPQEVQREESKIPYPNREVIKQMTSGVTPHLAGAMKAFIGSAAGRQTLIQPALPTHLTFTDQVPLPNVMIWAREQEQPKKIVAPRPTPPAASTVAPSVDLPNQETQLAEVSMVTRDVALRSMPIAAGTSSPIQTHSQQPIPMTHATVSATLDEQPTPAAVLSLSDIRMNEGTIVLPPVNDTSGPAKISGGAGAAGSPANPGKEASRDDVDDVTTDGRRLSSEHITMPRDGKFNVVVVGTSLEDEYPETAEFWANRVAYTAYLHVGLKKNWILQYSLTRAAETSGAGRVARLEAPWPYDIRRPNLISRDVNGDALMVHGILNQSGHFDSLAIAFPRGFRYASFVLYTLRQWQFRPAQQNGQATPVEVLLIIPEELD